MPSILNSDSGAVTGSAGLKFTAGDDGILEIQNSGSTAVKLSDSFLKVPTGNTAQRPASPENGMIRFNSDTGELEGYLGGAWKTIAGSEPTLKLDFDLFQMDSRISFTRATNGTYYDYAGILRTAGSGVARFDHRLENGAWVNKGLLIEEQRTNSIGYSEQFNDAYWTKINVSVTADNTTAPNGLTTADRILETVTSGVHLIQRQITGITSTSSSPITLSFFIKGGLGRTRGFMQLEAEASPFATFRGIFNLSTETISGSAFNGGVHLSSRIENVGNGWYRISISGYNSITNGNIYPKFVIMNDSGQDNYAGDTSKGFYFWGAQLETGRFPSSYIATTTVGVTRNQDSVTMTGTNFSSWFNNSEGTVFCDWDNIGFNAVNNYIWQIDDTTNLERYILNTYTTGASNDVTDNNTSQTNALFSTYNPISFQNYRNAFAYKVNDFATSFNGEASIIDTNGSLPTVTRLVLGESSTTATRPLNGHIAKFYYWPTRQPNEKLVSLTQ